MQHILRVTGAKMAFFVGIVLKTCKNVYFVVTVDILLAVWCSA